MKWLCEESILELIEDSKFMTINELSNKYNRSESSVRQLLNRRKLKPLASDRRIFTPIDTYFDDPDTEKAAYWAGFIAADGCIRDTNDLVIKLSIQDYNFLKQFDINGSLKAYKNVCTLYLHSDKICNKLSEYNITPRKSLTLEFPTNINLYNISHFIRGYFDGDGCVFNSATKNTRFVQRPRFTILGTKQFLQKLVQTLPFSNNIQIKKKHGGNIYYISIYKEANQFYDFIYKNATIYMHRKKEKADKLISAFSKYIKPRPHLKAPDPLHSQTALQHSLE